MNTKRHMLENPDELKRLYLDKGLTCRQIAKHYGCSKHPVLDALKELGITRDTRTPGVKPTCAQLRQWVEVDHLTLAEMAENTGAHYTGVRWWIKQCGIPWNGDSWGQRNLQRGLEKPSPEQLEEWYAEDGLSLQAIAEQIGATRQYIKDRFAEYGIEARASGWSHKAFECADGHIVKSTYELRVDNWLYRHHREHVYEYLLADLGGTSSADFKVGDVFVEVWGVMDSPRYNKRKEVKARWYKENGHRLISINYWDFSSQKNGLWRRKLQALLL